MSEVPLYTSLTFVVETSSQSDRGRARISWTTDSCIRGWMPRKNIAHLKPILHRQACNDAPTPVAALGALVQSSGRGGGVPVPNAFISNIPRHSWRGNIGDVRGGEVSARGPWRRLAWAPRPGQSTPGQGPWEWAWDGAGSCIRARAPLVRRCVDPDHPCRHVAPRSLNLHPSTSLL